MKIYETIYSWNVFDEIARGKNVYMLDRQNQSVALVNDMDAQSAISVVHSKNTDKRYDFWICNEGAVDNE